MGKFLRQKFLRGEFESTSERAQAVVSEIETVLLPEREPPQDPTGARLDTLLLSAATFTDEFVDQQLKLVERLETMIDRAVKRLIQIKMMKQMLGQSASYPDTAAMYDEMAAEEIGHRDLLLDPYRKKFG